jgi:membrane protein insertase Oxa1/YidC/SpoIIIJ
MTHIDPGFSTPPTPPVPPTAPGAIPGQRPIWATVVGVIAIIFGVFGALGGCWGLATPFVLPLLLKLLAGNPQAAAGLQANTDFAWLIAGQSLVLLALAALLLVAGVGVLQRRKAAIARLRIWAIAKMIVVPIVGFVGFYIQTKAAQAQQAADPTLPAGAAQVQNMILAISVVLNIVIGWAFPIFVLVWTSREVIREQVADWN